MIRARADEYAEQPISQIYKGYRLVPLTEHLANVQFRSDLDRLRTKAALGSTDRPAREVAEARSCRCKCGQSVVTGRKFVNQGHYNRWLSEERYFGKNRRPGS